MKRARSSNPVPNVASRLDMQKYSIGGCSYSPTCVAWMRGQYLPRLRAGSEWSSTSTMNRSPVCRCPEISARGQSGRGFPGHSMAVSGRSSSPTIGLQMLAKASKISRASFVGIESPEITYRHLGSESPASGSRLAAEKQHSRPNLATPLICSGPVRRTLARLGPGSEDSADKYWMVVSGRRCSTPAVAERRTQEVRRRTSSEAPGPLDATSAPERGRARVADRRQHSQLADHPSKGT